MAWFHVFFLYDVIEIGQLMGYFEKQAIPSPRIHGFFDITVSMHSDFQFRRHFRMSRETVEVLTRMIGNCRYYLHKKNNLLGNAPLSEKVAQKIN